MSLKSEFFRSLKYPLVILRKDWGTARLNIFCRYGYRRAGDRGQPTAAAAIGLHQVPGTKIGGFFGWLLQREFNQYLTFGAELYYKTADSTDGEDSEGYTIGTIINLTDNHHLLFSVGQDVDGPNYYNVYVAYQYTFGLE